MGCPGCVHELHGGWPRKQVHPPISYSHSKYKDSPSDVNTIPLSSQCLNSGCVMLSYSMPQSRSRGLDQSVQSSGTAGLRSSYTSAEWIHWLAHCTSSPSTPDRLAVSPYHPIHRMDRVTDRDQRSLIGPSSLPVSNALVA